METLAVHGTKIDRGDVRKPSPRCLDTEAPFAQFPETVLAQVADC
jgi:hypothetical protein